MDTEQLRNAYRQARDQLLAERTAAGHWVGELSSSALSTATAISALAIARQASAADASDESRSGDQKLIQQGLAWLARAQNADGGWGDTDRSYSNIATSMLVVAAFHLSDQAEQFADSLAAGSAYVERTGASEAVRQRFGKDQTFSVPILTNSALAGLTSWREVTALPFELACIPQSLYRWARMPVVSYAIPALVAIGQARFFHARPSIWPIRWIRAACVPRSLQVLLRMQPDSGGYLEAVPLTSFVAMSLAATGRHRHRVTTAGLRFLRDSVRADGSWPIDTNLATWTTTLALGALAPNASGDREANAFSPDVLQWLLACQHTVRHPFTGAAPGGWGWTNLSGAVPDADDTAGALLALAAWQATQPNAASNETRIASSRLRQAASRGVRWLLDIQNRDGGWPTFCRGWGKLPFDRSGADLTAHAMRALHAWYAPSGSPHQLPGVRPGRIATALQRGLKSLQMAQHADGSWVPLWFGNQDQPAEQNPVYGTARVLLALGCLGKQDSHMAQRGFDWLVQAQQPEGSWTGGPCPPNGPHLRPPGSVEETAVAVEALVAGAENPAARAARDRGLGWLIAAVSNNRHRETSPIGFYFAKLWYYERLYPLVFSVAALGRAIQQVDEGRKVPDHPVAGPPDF